MIVSAIAAMASNRVIGQNGGLPWNIPKDMQFFRNKTKGHIMVMGRKTFESFPKLLPGRLHIIITRQPDYHPAQTHVFHSVDDAFGFCRELLTQKNNPWGEEVFVVGGGEIYRQALEQTDRVYLTEIHCEIEGDTKFPPLPADEFRETSRDKNSGEVTFDFVTYERVKS